jgi:serine/threonine-protein kinase RsbW
MRDEAEDAVRPSDAWRTWAQGLPLTAREALSGIDFAAPHVHITPPAVPAEMPGVRAGLRRWAQSVEMGADQAEDMVLAADEAVANAIEHAYVTADGRPGGIVVFAGRLSSGTAVHVVVSDKGRWRPPSADSGFRGRGVSMMKMLTDHFDLHHDESGTTVWLCWNLR